MTNSDDDIDGFLATLTPRQHAAVMRKARGMLPPGTGKWGQPGIPKKGWTCIEVYDLAEGNDQFTDENMIVCEMCEGPLLRYVHLMQHPDLTETLKVGYTCAQHMKLNYAARRPLTGRRRRTSTNAGR